MEFDSPSLPIDCVRPPPSPVEKLAAAAVAAAAVEEDDDDEDAAPLELRSVGSTGMGNLGDSLGESLWSRPE